MNDFGCAECRELAAELALNIVTGRTRARAMAHLTYCVSCSDTVRSLAVVADRLVELLPEKQPPDGFVDRVIARLAVNAESSQRRPAPIAAMLIALVLTAVALMLGGSAPGTGDRNGDMAAPSSTVVYAPLRRGQQQVGAAFLYPGNPGYIRLSMRTDLRLPSGIVRCDVLGTDGSSTAVGEFTIRPGQSEWEAPMPSDAPFVVGATVSDLRGHTLGTARFTRPASVTPAPASRPRRLGAGSPGAPGPAPRAAPPPGPNARLASGLSAGSARIDRRFLGRPRPGRDFDSGEARPVPTRVSTEAPSPGERQRGTLRHRALVERASVPPPSTTHPAQAQLHARPTPVERGQPGVTQGITASESRPHANKQDINNSRRHRKLLDQDKRGATHTHS